MEEERSVRGPWVFTGWERRALDGTATERERERERGCTYWLIFIQRKQGLRMCVKRGSRVFISFAFLSRGPWRLFGHLSSIHSLFSFSHPRGGVFPSFRRTALTKLYSSPVGQCAITTTYSIRLETLMFPSTSEISAKLNTSRQ